MINKLLLSSLFFSSMIMCMEGVLDREQTKFETSAYEAPTTITLKIFARAINFLNLLSHRNSSANRTTKPPRDVFIDDERAEECSDYWNLPTKINKEDPSPNKVDCCKLIPCAVATSFALASLLYYKCCLH